jgi:elongation factor Ts
MNIENIKKLRKETGVGVMDAKRALVKAGGNFDKALIALKEEGVLIAKKKAAKITKFSTIGYYIHTNQRVAVLIELACESEVASATDVFRNLANDIAMHIVAMKPSYISYADVPQDFVEQLRDEFMNQAKIENKPKSIIDKMVEGKLKKYWEINCLLEQKYYRDESTKVQDVLTEYVYLLKENIEVKRFVRYETGRV